MIARSWSTSERRAHHTPPPAPSTATERLHDTPASRACASQTTLSDRRFPHRQNPSRSVRGIVELGEG